MTVISIIIAIFVFSFIIIFHELGHFSFAKMFDVQVNEFTLGFGPTIIGKQVGETLFAWKLLPFGGSCAMEGEDEESDSPRAFNKKKIWQKFLIVFFGPGFNFILAFLLSLLLTGVAGVDLPIVDTVIDGSPAYEAGVLPGDEIISLGGEKVNFYRDVRLYTVTDAGKTATMTLMRDGVEYSYTITPAYSEETGRYTYGVSWSGERTKVGFFDTIRYSLYEVGYWIKYVIKSLGMMVTGRVSANDISGPVGIVKTIGDTVIASSESGALYVFLNVLNISILLTANLGVMNLLPFPALDGGRLVMFIIEAIRRKPLPVKVEGAINMAGLMLLFGLMFLILFNDVRKIIFPV